MNSEVRRNPERSRYELWLDGEVAGIADYAEMGEVVVLPHTEIRASLRNRGLGAELVRGALDDLRSRGQRVDPQCWYVAQFIDEHAEYADLLAA